MKHIENGATLIFMSKNKAFITNIELGDEHNHLKTSPLANEYKTAIADLTHESMFKPCGPSAENGPFDLRISIEDSKLLIQTTDSNKEGLPLLVLSLTPYRRIIQDYFLMLKSYEEARHTATSCKLEAIDMGRRGIHNEGADLLINRLKGKVEMDHETARRIFTLICALHKTNLQLLG